MDQIKNLTENQIKILEIEALQNEIKNLQDKINIIRSTIDFKPQKVENRLYISNILEQVSHYTDYKPEEILSKTRIKELVKARSLFINLCLDLTHHSSNSIGIHLKKDHTTILYHKNIKANKDKYWNNKRAEGVELWRDYNNIKTKLVLETTR